MKKERSYRRIIWTAKLIFMLKKYSATIAQEYADRQATSKGVPIKLGKRYDYANYAAERTKAGDSPDVIVNTLKREGKWTVFTTTPYRYIEQGYNPRHYLERPVREIQPETFQKK